MCVGGGWVSVDRRLFRRCGASVDLELSYLETLLSLEVNGSSEGILYDDIYIFCMCIIINVNYVCGIDHYNFGGSHASDIIICLNGSLRGITNHVSLCVMYIYFAK